MMHRTGTIIALRGLQAMIRKCNGLPSPPARWIAGELRNFCPQCDALTVSGPPWSCSSCGWSAVSNPKGCCLRISRIRRRLSGGYALPIAGADPDSPGLTAAERTAIIAHLGAAIDIDETDLGDNEDDS